MIRFKDSIKSDTFISNAFIWFCVANIFNNELESSHSNDNDNTSSDLLIKSSSSYTSSMDDYANWIIFGIANKIEKLYLQLDDSIHKQVNDFWMYLSIYSIDLTLYA